MTEHNPQEQKVKHDPAVMTRKIIEFLGQDITKKPKLSRTMLDDILEEFNADRITLLKDEVKNTFKEILEDSKKLQEAERTFQQAREQAGKALNEKLQKLTQRIDKVEQEKADTRAVVAGLTGTQPSEPPFIEVNLGDAVDTSTLMVPGSPLTPGLKSTINDVLSSADQLDLEMKSELSTQNIPALPPSKE